MRWERARLEAGELAPPTISQLISFLAHELKHSMAIIGNCEEVIELRASGSGDIQRECDAIRRAMRAALGRPRGLKVMFNPTPPKREIVFVRSIVSRLPSEIERVAMSVGLPGDEVFVPVDSDPIQLAFEILFANSKRAMAIKRRAKKQRAQDTVEFTAPATELEVLRVWRYDRCGMSRESRERCFEPFFTTSQSQFGLRLFAARRIVDAHDGRIAVESLDGDEACFTIALPRHAAVELG